MKRFLALAVSSMAALFFFAAPGKAYAIIGDLNYQLGQPPGQTQQCPAQDTKALEACTKLKDESQTHLASCQQATKLLEETHDALKKQKTTYLWIAIANGALALALGTAALILALKRKTSSVSSPTP